MQTEQLEKSSEHKQKEKVKAYTPAVLFPQRIQKAKKEEQFSKFLENFKKIEINIPFAVDIDILRSSYILQQTIFLRMQ